MIRLLQVPYDSGHRNARMGRGPERFIERGVAERLRRAGHEVQLAVIEPDSAWRAEIQTAFELNRALADAVHKAIQGGDLPLVLAGNCNTAVGTVAGLPDTTGVIWFDAHGDFAAPETSESGFLDGMGLAILTGRCFPRLAQTLPDFSPTPDEHILTIGMRSLDPDEIERFAAAKVTQLSVAQLREGALIEHLKALRSQVKEVYVHLDLDVLDPSVAPANFAAAKGGLQPDELITVLRLIKERFAVVAATIASYDPKYDPDAQLIEIGLEALEVLSANRRV